MIGPDMQAICTYFFVVVSVVSADYSKTLTGNFPSLDDNIVAGYKNNHKQLDPHCSHDANHPANVTVTADMDVNVFIHCENGRTFHVDQDEDQVHYIAHVHYSGNASGDNCVFHSNNNSQFYQVALEIYFIQNGVFQYKDAYIVTCSYAEYGTNETQGNEVDVPIVAPYETYKHLHRVHNHTHTNDSSTFNVDILDNRDQIVIGQIPLGKKIKIRVTMTAGSAAEVGFHVFMCEAKGSEGTRPFAFIREGCGEGFIIPKKLGFTSNGLTAESPFFKAFGLYGSPAVTHECHFYVCHENCDGSSCIYSHFPTGSARRRRDTSFVSHDRGMQHSGTGKPRVRHSVKRIRAGMTSVNEDIDFANHFNSLNDDTNQQKVKFNKDDKIYETLEKSKKNTVGTHESRNTNAEVPFASSRERKSLKPCTRKTEESGKSMNDGTKQRKLMSSEDMQHNSLRMKILSPEQVQFDRPEMELHVKILTIILMSAASIALMAMFVTVTCILYKNSSRLTTLIIQD
ncbi:uncharacterized protein LOC143063790 isoform X2 [Mytilus galloprovincialis]|uniref:uncharacterized protein LOC143063790 isoform X2 n=1 Tax=Mytilus galloprovincialis TaxID=29158 RepID=UPI003F7B8E1D